MDGIASNEKKKYSSWNNSLNFPNIEIEMPLEICLELIWSWSQNKTHAVVKKSVRIDLMKKLSTELWVARKKLIRNDEGPQV